MHKRLYYLDNLKTFALLLGLIFHTIIIYAKGVGYPIKSGELSYAFTILVHFIHVFRMQLFFFLSGFFSYMVLDKKGGKNFTFSRLERILSPIIIGILCFAPVQYFLEYNQTHSPIAFWTYYPLFFSVGEFNFSHIWFLIYLIIFSFLLITNYKLKIIKRISNYSFFGIRSKIVKLDLYLNSKFTEIQIFFFFAVLVSLIFIFVSNLFYNKDDTILLIRPFAFFYYICFFAFGVISYQKNLLQNLHLPIKVTEDKFRLFFSSIGLILLFALYLYLDEVDPYWMNFTYEVKRTLIRLGHLSIESILAWSLIFVLLFIFKNYLDYSNHFLDYLRNSGMSIYLIHQPIALILGDYLLDVKIPILLKVTIHIGMVYLLSFFFYHFVIKKSFILKRVFGTK